jgi:hypothetical protein
VRQGQNPAKFIYTLPQPAPVTVAVVVYIPFLEGYYAQSLEVLKACLGSIWANTTGEYDLMVFDNASCPEVRRYLQEQHQQGKIQYLVLSDKNVGKTGAWNFIFGAAPGETVVYADGDIYFHPGWLPAQLEALETFPNAGMVTGMPLRTPPEFSTATIAWAEDQPDVEVKRGQLLPWEEYWQHSRSLGLEQAQARKNYESSEDVCLLKNGKCYYGGAAHFQFTAPKSVLKRVLPIEATKPMGQVRQLDVAINALGCLRISTPDWWISHMGNVLEAGPQTVDDRPRTAVGGRRSVQSRLLDWTPIKRLLMGLYGRIFRWYFTK